MAVGQDCFLTTKHTKDTKTDREADHDEARERGDVALEERARRGDVNGCPLWAVEEQKHEKTRKWEREADAVGPAVRPDLFGERVRAWFLPFADKMRFAAGAIAAGVVGGRKYKKYGLTVSSAGRGGGNLL